MVGGLPSENQGFGAATADRKAGGREVGSGQGAPLVSSARRLPHLLPGSVDGIFYLGKGGLRMLDGERLQQGQHLQRGGAQGFGIGGWDWELGRFWDLLRRNYGSLNRTRAPNTAGSDIQRNFSRQRSAN